MTIGIHDGAAADSGGVAVYTDTDRDNLRISLLAASAGGMSVVIRDKSTAHHMAKVLGSNNQTPIVVDPGRWRHQDASPQRPIGINADGLTDLNLRTWGHNYVSAAGISAVLTPSLFVPSQEWETLQALTDTIGNALDVGDPIIGLIATDAAMLDVNNITAFLELLEPIRHLRLGFVFGGDREALAYRDRLTGLRTLLEEHTGAWLIGIDGLVATEALCAGAGLVGVGVRPGMRWPAVPGKKSNGGGGAKDFVPGLFNRDLMEYRSPPVYADWYFDTISTACAICGRHPEKYNASPMDKQAIAEHNVHGVAELCRNLLSVPVETRDEWIRMERVEAATNHRGLYKLGTKVVLDKTLQALIQRDIPGWYLALEEV